MNDATLDLLHRDATDPLAGFRDEFLIPRDAAGREVAYFTGNSLGLQPRAARTMVERELERWATLGVEATSAATCRGWTSTPRCASTWRRSPARCRTKWW